MLMVYLQSSPMPQFDLIQGRSRPCIISAGSYRALNYSPIEKMCLSLYFAATKLRHYFLSTTVLVIARTDLIKYMLTRPVLKGRIGKWILGLSEFTFRYVPMKAVKGQAFADFLADHAMNVFEPVELDEEVLAFAEVVPWTLYFDGSSTLGAAGAGVVLISPSGQAPQAAKRLKFQTWRYHRLGKTAFVRSLSFSDEGEWQSLVQLRSRSSYLIERVMLKFFFSYLGLTPRKTKDGRARTDILGKALMNYAIPDTYAVRYQPSDIAHKAKRPLAPNNTHKER